MDASTLYARIRARLDLEDSEFVSDLEQGQLAQEAYFELWDILCSSLGDETPWEREVVQTTPGEDYVDLPVELGAYRILRMDVALSGATQWRPLYPGVIGSDPLDVDARAWSDGSAITYYAHRRARANDSERAGETNTYSAWRIHFDPTPDAAYNVRVWFVPGPPILMGDGTGSPVIPIGSVVSFPNDYPEFVVARVCAQLAIKQEADPKPFMAEAERIRHMIETRNKPHQITAPRRIVDARQWQPDADAAHPFMRRR